MNAEPKAKAAGNTWLMINKKLYGTAIQKPTSLRVTLLDFKRYPPYASGNVCSVGAQRCRPTEQTLNISRELAGRS